jgi:O-antigen/teichoic acid export membrane protein
MNLDRLRGKLLQDAAILQISGTLNQASQLFSSILIAFLLGAVGQGRYAVAVVLQGLFYNLVNIGVLQAAVSQIAGASARGLVGKVSAWMGYVAKFYIVFNSLLLVLGVLFLPAVAQWWYGDRELGVWAAWLCVWPLVETPRAAVFAAFQGTRRMLALGHVENVQELLRVFLVVAGAVITGSVAGAVLGEIVSRVFAAVVAMGMYARARTDGGPELPSLGEVWRHLREVPLRSGLRMSFKVGVLKNTNTLFLHVFPRLLLAGSAGMAWVAYFHVAQRIMGLPLMLMQGVSRALLPALSQLVGLREMHRFRAVYNKTTLAAGSLITAGILLALPLIPLLVGWFYPADYAAPVLRYSLILALGYVPMSFAVGLESFYIVTGLLRVSIVLSIIGCLVTIPVNVVLMILLPESGAVWGLSVYMSWVLVHFVYIALYFRRTEKAVVVAR